MVDFIKTLRERDGEIKNGYGIFWRDLPNLSDFLSRNWHCIDPISSTTGQPNQRSITEWQNLNSFLARLTSKDFCPWLQLPIWELRNALECPPSKGDVMECRLWIASEWILLCGNVLLHNLTGEYATGSFDVSLMTGPLCNNVRSLGRERWEFWKTRFCTIGDDYKDLELSSGIYFRIGDTLRSMFAAERENTALNRAQGFAS
ncbi:hypothetical protein F4781DRAFT_397313 [Annulohypoxylon bovei var. microspora]|nr:hypothetical protein F4781DRAFT_397313 [Annulohypoxylon bovei var. microspora]